MTREEAVKAVMRMMSAYTSFRCSEESMLVLAEVLMQFPLETATAAASPIHGAPKKYRDFPLNAGQLSEWCEDAAEYLYEKARLERESRTAWLPAPDISQPTEAELDAQFKRLGLWHLRRGSKCPGRPSREEAERAAADLERLKAAAERGSEEWLK